MKKQFFPNFKRSTGIFRSKFLKRLFKTHFSVPILIYVPVVTYFVHNAIVLQQNNVTDFAVVTGCGFIVWTFIEYTLHRFVFHFPAKSAIGKRIHLIFHGMHHAYPNDAKRLVISPSASIPMVTAFYFFFYALVPDAYLPGFFAAFIAGYLFYEIFHYTLHHVSFNSFYWRKLRQHHMLHHDHSSDTRYGVTTSLWDRIFRSHFDDGERKSKWTSEG